MTKFITVLIVFSFLFATQFSNAKELENSPESIHTEGGEGSVKIGDCPAACDVRCSATSHKSACLMYCNLCCKKCLCVPSGTYGNKEECPCYNNLKTKEGGPKCP
ncbi:gibberellin-regulated protein 12-like [Raphanus sativus]|uniref:Gibberellin-regulated protein 12-like n=1 Tax=Raphanus sativus TaxID=3726 RepID=A0A6J0JU15_RAPSA|nr:gibberellin-regulated protein 12-like [Raphanus sativus]